MSNEHPTVEAEKVAASVDREEQLRTRVYPYQQVLTPQELAEVLIEVGHNEETMRIPPIEVTFSFGPHVGGNEITGIENKLFEDADIYVPERLGWNRMTAFDYNLYALGENSKKEKVPPTYLERYITYSLRDFISEQHNLIYKSHKPILFADVPGDSPIFNAIMELDKQLELRQYDKTFDEALGILKNNLETEAELNKQREEYIAEHIQIEIMNFLRLNKAFQQKEKLKILVSLGSSHTGIYHTLKEETDYKIARDHKSKELASTHNNVALRKLNFGKELEQKDLAKTLASTAIVNSIYRNTIVRKYGFEEGLRRIYRVVESLPEEHIRETYNYVQQYIANETNKVDNTDFEELFAYTILQEDEEIREMLDSV